MNILGIPEGLISDAIRNVPVWDGNVTPQGRQQGYEIWIDDLRFPMAPETINISLGGASTVIDLADTSQISVPKKPGLLKVSFTLRIPTVFKAGLWWLQSPQSRTWFTAGNLQFNPIMPGETARQAFGSAERQTVEYRQADYIDKLESLSVAGLPFNLVIIRRYNEQVMQSPFMKRVTIEPYQIRHDAQVNRHDMLVDLTFLEYRDPISYTGSMITNADGTTSWKYTQNPSQPLPAIPEYTAVESAEDTVWKICQRFYGEGDFWKQVVDANKDLGILPNFLEEGMVIRLPSWADLIRGIVN